MKEPYDMPPSERALYDAIAAWNEAVAECERFRADCQGTWGYYGVPYEKAVDEAWDSVKVAASL